TAMSDVNAEPWNREWSEQGIKDWNSKIIEEFRTNSGKVGGAYAGGDLLLLTTTGARSGKRHTVPLAYLTEGSRLIVSSLAVAAYPAWYRNLMAHPRVTVELGSQTFEATATVVTGEEREHLWTWITQQWPNLVDHQAKTTLQVPLVALQR